MHKQECQWEKGRFPTERSHSAMAVCVLPPPLLYLGSPLPSQAHSCPSTTALPIHAPSYEIMILFLRHNCAYKR